MFFVSHERWVVGLVAMLAVSCARVGFDERSDGVPNHESDFSLRDASSFGDGFSLPDSSSLTDGFSLADAGESPGSDAIAPIDAGVQRDGNPADIGGTADAGVVDSATVPADAASAADAGALAIISTPPGSVGRYSLYSYDAAANRPDPLQWSLVAGPSGMIIDPNTGEVTWSPNGAIGSVSVRIRVTWDNEWAEQQFTVYLLGGSINGLRPAAFRSQLRRLRAMAQTPLAGASPTDEPAVRYVASCASLLEHTQQAVRAWRGGPCHRVCQELISSCVLARLNTRGMPIAIAFDTGLSEAEGAFFGNLFLPQPELYSCSGPQPAPRGIGRDCALPNNACGISWTGRCEAACRIDGNRIINCQGFPHATLVSVAR